MRTFITLITSAMLVAAFGSATMAEELTDCAGHYDSKTGTTFARCPGITFEVGIQGTGAPGGGDGGAGAAGATGGSSGATGGNR